MSDQDAHMPGLEETQAPVVQDPLDGTANPFDAADGGNYGAPVVQDPQDGTANPFDAADGGNDDANGTDGEQVNPADDSNNPSDDEKAAFTDMMAKALTSAMSSTMLKTSKGHTPPKPIHGGLIDTKDGKIPWTGGKPKVDWKTGLETPTAKHQHTLQLRQAQQERQSPVIRQGVLASPQVPWC